MNRITIINKKEKYDILINNEKYIYGSNYLIKDTIINTLINYFNKYNDSEFASDNDFTSKIYFNDELLRISDFNLFHVNSYFDLSLDIKLGSKSLSLMYLNSLFNNIEYKEEFQTLSIILSIYLTMIIFLNFVITVIPIIQ